MKNIAIVPARSGSKGLKDKNIKLLNGLPLLYYSVEEAKRSEMFDTIMVSTDSEYYADIARSCGAEVPFLRSKENSRDNSGSWDAVLEVIKKYHDSGESFDTICLLQPTSPLRTYNDIKMGYQLMKEKHADSIISVCEMDHSPLWSNILPKDLSMKNFINEDLVNKPRQKLPIYYRINGALYIKKIEYNSNIQLLNKETYAIIMEKDHSIDIDTELDFKIAETLITSR